MKLQIMSIKDRALDAFMRPFYAQTVGQGTRMFEDLINEPGSDLNKHPEDYDLYHLGEWNDHNGLTENRKDSTDAAILAPQLIARATDLTNK